MIDPHVVVNSHRFLYYVLKCPCWLDAQYDAFKRNNKMGELSKPSESIDDYTPLEIQRAISSLNWHIMKNYVSFDTQRKIDWEVLKEAKEINNAFFGLNRPSES